MCSMGQGLLFKSTGGVCVAWGRAYCCMKLDTPCEQTWKNIRQRSMHNSCSGVRLHPPSRCCPHKIGLHLGMRHTTLGSSRLANYLGVDCLRLNQKRTYLCHNRSRKRSARRAVAVSLCDTDMEIYYSLTRTSSQGGFR